METILSQKLRSDSLILIVLDGQVIKLNLSQRIDFSIMITFLINNDYFINRTFMFYSILTKRVIINIFIVQEFCSQCFVI